MKVFLLALGLFACSGEPAPQKEAPGEPALTPIRLALNWFPEPEFGGFYEGVLSGAYEKAGFDVEILPGGPGAPTLELLASGKAEVAITSADDLLLKRAKGVAAIGVWPAFQLSPTGLMAHASGPVKRFEDIQGGRVALEVGGPLQRLLWQKYGLEGKVEMVPTSGSVSGFLADEALIQQAYITAEPCAVKAQGVETVFLKASDAGWNPYASLVAVADPAPAWAQAFVTVTHEAWSAYLADPSRANAEIARQNPQMTPALLPCITEAQRPFVTGADGLGAMTEARWNELNQSLVSLGMLPEGSVATGAYTSLR